MTKRNDPVARNKFWRTQSWQAAGYLKSSPIEQDPMKLTFIFDDTKVKIDVPAAQIREWGRGKLAEHLYLLITNAERGVH